MWLLAAGCNTSPYAGVSPHLRRHEPHFCLLRESGRLEAVLEAADGEEEGEDAPFWSPVGAGWAVRL